MDIHMHIHSNFKTTTPWVTVSGTSILLDLYKFLLITLISTTICGNTNIIIVQLQHYVLPVDYFSTTKYKL